MKKGTSSKRKSNSPGSSSPKAHQGHQKGATGSAAPSPSPPKSPPNKGDSQNKGKGSSAPPPTPPWPSPKSSEDEPPAYVYAIFEHLQRMQERMDGFESNYFKGFSPKKSLKGQQTTQSPSTSPKPDKVPPSENLKDPQPGTSKDSRSTPSVVIEDPPIKKTPLHLVPERWKILHDGMA